MDGLGGVEEMAGRTGGSEGGGNLLGDDAGLTDPGQDGKNRY